MKIVDITEFYSERGGGVRSHLTSRGHFLCQSGHQHTVIAPGPRDEETVGYWPIPASGGPRKKLSSPAMGDGGCARVMRIAGPTLPYDHTYHLLGRLDKIRAWVNARHPDVLEAHSPYLATAAVLACGRRAARLRTAFWHADHLSAYVRPALESALNARAAATITGALMPAVRALLAPYDATFVGGKLQAESLRSAGVSNVVHAPFGVDLSVFCPAARRESKRRELLGDAGERAALIVGVGRFAVEKRWDMVLEAFERLRQRRPAVLALFGDGPERQRLERRAPPGVKFLGFERDRGVLASSLASADLLVHGCPCETFGLSVAEAVACGLPVVVPDAGGAAESAPSETSETYRSPDAGACAAAIERVLAQDRRELRTRALEAASLVPTVEGHFDTVVATYRALLDQGRGNRSRLDAKPTQIYRTASG